MKVELDKQDLISLVMGTDPSYKAMENTLIKDNGVYCGGFHDRWEWNKSHLERYTEELLWEIYKICKRSK